MTKKTKTTTYALSTPARLPFLGTVVYTFLMYYFNAPGWGWGVYATLMILIWITSIIRVYNQKIIQADEVVKDIVDSFDKEFVSADRPESEKSKFQIRLEKLAKERGIKI